MTTEGTLTLWSRHRNGQFSTELFARYQRSEQALVLAMMEMVINGVSSKGRINYPSYVEEKFSKSTVSALCKNLNPMVLPLNTPSQVPLSLS